MLRRLALAAFVALFPALAWAQSPMARIAPTPPTSDNGNRIATTSWVNNFINSGSTLPGSMTFSGAAGTVGLNDSAALLEIIGANAVGDPMITTGAGQQIAHFFHGSSGSPVTTAAPSIGISRFETITTDTQGGQNATLLVNTIGNNVSSGVNSATTSLMGYATQIGKGDVQGVMGFAIQQGTAGHTAYGGYFNSNALSAGSSGFGVEVDIKNNTGSDQAYANLSPYPLTAGAHIQAAGGSNKSAAAIWIGDTGASVKFDSGIVFTSGTLVRSALIDQSASLNVVEGLGSHTNGINLVGATFSGAPILAPLMTPASSAAAGAAGAIKWDANFIYICTAANTWKRVALSAF